MECRKLFYYNNFRYKWKRIEVNKVKMNKVGRHYIWSVAANAYIFLPKHYGYPVLFKLLLLYSSSNLVCCYSLIVVLFSICLLHNGTCHYWVILCNAGVFTSWFVSVDSQCLASILRAKFVKCAVSGTKDWV